MSAPSWSRCLEVRWIDMRETGRAGHIVATHRGPGRNVLLIGHLDTVFEPDSPFQRFTRHGDRATGPGVGDDKGGVVVIVAAMRAMHAAGTLRDANITIVLTGDEERPGSPIAGAAHLRPCGQPICARIRESRRERAASSALCPPQLDHWTCARPGRPPHSRFLGMLAMAQSTSWRASDAFRRVARSQPHYNVRVMGAHPRRSTPTLPRHRLGKTNSRRTAIARGDILPFPPT